MAPPSTLPTINLSFQRRAYGITPICLQMPDPDKNVVKLEKTSYSMPFYNQTVRASLKL